MTVDRSKIRPSEEVYVRSWKAGSGLFLNASVAIACGGQNRARSARERLTLLYVLAAGVSKVNAGISRLDCRRENRDW
jgi:hypothetical protein